MEYIPQGQPPFSWWSTNSRCDATNLDLTLYQIHSREKVVHGSGSNAYIKHPAVMLPPIPLLLPIKIVSIKECKNELHVLLTVAPSVVKDRSTVVIRVRGT